MSENHPVVCGGQDQNAPQVKEPYLEAAPRQGVIVPNVVVIQDRRIKELEEKNSALEDLLTNMKEQLADSSLAYAGQNDFFSELVTLFNRRAKLDSNYRREPYNIVVKKFAITLFTYSPRAYG